MNKAKEIIKLIEASSSEKLSKYIKGKDFENIFIVKPSKDSMLGTDPRVLYLNLEPYNRELTHKYVDHLHKLIVKNIDKIKKFFSDKDRIVINDIVLIDMNTTYGV